MTHDPGRPQQGSCLTVASLLVLASLVAAPVLAAPEHDALCDESHEATLEVAKTSLEPVPAIADDALPESNRLKPRIAATAREVFLQGTDGAEDKAEVGADEADAEPGVPSLSDGPSKPFNRQMYRRDI